MYTHTHQNISIHTLDGIRFSVISGGRGSSLSVTEAPAYVSADAWHLDQVLVGLRDPNPLDGRPAFAKADPTDMGGCSNTNTTL